MAVSNASWDGSASNYADAAAYCAVSLIDTNAPGAAKIEANCKLPVKEPGGAVNRNAVHAAAAALAGGRGGVNASPADKKAAAKRLVSLYGQIGDPVPPSIKRMAG